MKKQARKVLYILLMVTISLLSHALLLQHMRLALTPHASVLALLYGIQFAFVPGLGYVSTALNVAITASCMGANLFMAAFLILTLGFPPTSPHRPRRARYVVLSYAGSLVGALLVSIVRIALSLPFTTWPNGQLIHTMISLAVYFGALVALYAAAQKMKRRTTHA